MSAKAKSNRKQDRIRAVLPVRVRGTDVSGNVFELLAHTLDLTPTGARLGAIRHTLKPQDIVTVLFRKRRIEFTVMWTKQLTANEHQIGLRMHAQESDPWGLSAGHTGPRLVIAASAISAAV
ncbi:MAG TPA: PilZ domain-containing protein [Candidatus Sulfotelmatobacter sp.]|jgi:hypothetical protein